MIYLEKDLSDSTVEDNSGDSMVEGREMFTSVMVILSGRDKGLNSRVNRVTREERNSKDQGTRALCELTSKTYRSLVFILFLWN